MCHASMAIRFGFFFVVCFGAKVTVMDMVGKIILFGVFVLVRR